VRRQLRFKRKYAAAVFDAQSELTTVAVQDGADRAWGMLHYIRDKLCEYRSSFHFVYSPFGVLPYCLQELLAFLEYLQRVFGFTFPQDAGIAHV
jgi:hypothetical protein